MKILCAIGLAVGLAGCSMFPSKPPIVLPPEIIKIPTFVPLPDECHRLQSVPVPPGSTAEQVLAAQHAAILAYESQVNRCFAPPKTP